jgi:hypothetical protein
MKTILLILALSGSLSAEVGVSLYTNGITKSASDARYVLRNPYYDGSQSVTVASFTNAGASTLTGKVGIGKAPGSYELDVNGGIYAQYTSVFASNLSVNGSAFSVCTSTLVVKGGKVGVGTTAPLVPLHIAASGGADMYLQRSDSTSPYGRITMNGISGASRTPGEAIIGGDTGLAFQTDPSPTDTSDNLATRMFITSAGNVGIGTTAPESKLHVAAGLVTISTATTSVSFTTFGGAATKEELIALAPSKLFQYMTCTDCPTATLVCSTGTSAGNWANAADKTATPW